MTDEKLKEVLHMQVEEADERLLRSMYAMASAYMSIPPAGNKSLPASDVPPSDKWKKQSIEEFIHEVNEANASIDRGEYRSLKDLKDNRPG